MKKLSQIQIRISANTFSVFEIAMNRKYCSECVFLQSLTFPPKRRKNYDNRKKLSTGKISQKYFSRQTRKYLNYYI